MLWSLSEFLNFLEIEKQDWRALSMEAGSKHHVGGDDLVRMYFVTDGVCRLSVSSGTSNENLTLTQGDVAVVFAREAHTLISEHPAGQNAAAVGKILQGELAVRWPAGFESARMPNLIRISEDSNPLNMQQFSIQEQTTTCEPVLMRAALFILVSAIRNHPECEDIFRNANFRDQIARAVQYMEVHPFRDWTVSSLARKVGMSRSAFASRFFYEMGKPPMATLTELRMAIAEKLLTQTNLKITDVAQRVGYRSESAFLRRFMTHFKTPPSKMRMKYQETARAFDAGHAVRDSLTAISSHRSAAYSALR